MNQIALRKTLAFHIFLFAFLFLFSSIGLAQKKTKEVFLGHLEFEGIARSEGVGIPGVKISVVDDAGKEIKFVSKEGGNFLMAMPFLFKYTIQYTHPDYLPRHILVNSHLPESERAVVYSLKFNIEMYPKETLMPKDLIALPAVKVLFNESFLDFEYEPSYVKRMQAEFKREKEILEANALANAAGLKAQADSIAKDKIKQDSLAKLAIKQQKVADSLLLVKQEIALAKEQDSIAKIATRKQIIEEARRSIREDSLMKAEAKRKSMNDSIAKEKQVELAKEAATKKALDDKQAKVKSDSLLLVSKAIAAEKKEQAGDKLANSIPKIDRVYPEGVTEETLIEPRRMIDRTVVKRGGTQSVLHKVVYDWGGVYFFKDESIISRSVYEIETKQAKEFKAGLQN